MQQISKIDLEPIMIKAMDKEEGYGWSKQQAIDVAHEYKKFLQMCFAHPEKPIVPSSVVDDFWHLHILDTQKYAADCQDYLGYFLHHFPYFGMRGEQDAKNLTEAWQETKNIYTQMFGELPQHLWPNSNRCPNCGKRCRDDAADAFMNTRPSFKSLGI